MHPPTKPPIYRTLAQTSTAASRGLQGAAMVQLPSLAAQPQTITLEIGQPFGGGNREALPEFAIDARHKSFIAGHHRMDVDRIAAGVRLAHQIDFAQCRPIDVVVIGAAIGQQDAFGMGDARIDEQLVRHGAVGVADAIDELRAVAAVAGYVVRLRRFDVFERHFGWWA